MSIDAKTRRDFLKGSAAVAGAALAARVIGSRAYAGSDDLIRVGMVGCGGRGSGAANQTLSVPNSKVKIVAMADAFDNKVKGAHGELSKKHGEKVDVPAERMFSGLDAFNKVLEHCDMVILATPPGFRPQHFEAAVNAGKNVFMEKPVCVDSNGARKVLEMAKKADEKGLKVVCGLQRHYQNVYREALKRVQDGIIGDIISAQVYWNQGDIWYRNRDAAQNEIQFQVNNWYHFNWLCGDHICEQHVHNLDVANWFIGAHPISASGMGGRTDKTRKTEIFDHHYVEFRYPNNIVVNSQCRQIGGTKSDVREEIRGTKGILYLGNGHAVDYKGNTLWKYDNGGKRDPDPYQVEHNELHGFIRDNQKVNNAYYTLDSTFTAVLGRTATYSGQEWKWDDLWKKDFGTFPKEAPTWSTDLPNKPDANGNYQIPVPGQYKI
ncbi:MAG TPA: Gfo/Idh/MocA family oxidoreductase [Planctomycetota bacterium]|nr:Gfo/Idh/MocA family oxidoreductase [Planctomycetota bacterium]